MFPNSTNQQAASNSMLFDFQYVELFPLTMSDLLGNLLTAIVCGLIIAFVYKLTHKENCSASFVNSLIILPIVTAVVILLIGNNVARAFGLVGAMSIIRFRTALRDTQDIIFIFFALAIGMAAGIGLDTMAVITTLVISTVIYFVVKLNPNAVITESYMLHIRYGAGAENETNLGTLLSTYCAHIKLLSHEKLADVVNLLSDAVYQVQIAKGKSGADLVKQLNNLITDCQVKVKMVDENGKPVKTDAVTKTDKKRQLVK